MTYIQIGPEGLPEGLLQAIAEEGEEGEGGSSTVVEVLQAEDEEKPEGVEQGEG